MKTANIPIFVPHKGCPNDCIFCNQRKITGQTEEMTPERAEKIIRQYLPTLQGKRVEIAFFGGSFTAINPALQEGLLQAAYPYVQSGAVSGIRLSTRPDCIDEAGLRLLKRYGVTTIELGAQSMNDAVLLAARRGHTAQRVEQAARLVQAFGFTLGLQMMTGLPGDSREAAMETGRRFALLKPDFVRIYPTIVIESTGLCDLYRAGGYTPQTMEEAADLCADLLLLFEEAAIPVIRIGLQPSDTLEGGYVAGPYHVSFGEFAKSRMWLKKALRFQESHPQTQLAIRLPQRLLSQLCGHRSENWRQLVSALGYRPKRMIDAAAETICFTVDSKN